MSDGREAPGDERDIRVRTFGGGGADELVGTTGASIALAC